MQYMQAIAADPAAAAALGGFAIHGYAPDGISSAGADPAQWSAWANGWKTSPAAGIPANVAGFTSYGKPSWMTETSGEKPEWLASSQSGGFPDQGAFSLALKLHQALTTGQENACPAGRAARLGDGRGRRSRQRLLARPGAVVDRRVDQRERDRGECSGVAAGAGHRIVRRLHLQLGRALEAVHEERAELDRHPARLWRRDSVRSGRERP
jgi:hypothetical protein